MAIRDNLVVLERLRNPDDLETVTLGKLRQFAVEPFGVGRHVEEFLEIVKPLPDATLVELTPGRCRVLYGDVEVLNLCQPK